MRQRFISGAIGSLILIIVLISDKIILNIGVAIVSFAALLEMYSALGLTKYFPLKALGLCASFALTFAQAFNNKLLMPVLYIYIALLFALYIMDKSNLKLKDISKMFFITIYISFFMVHIVFIRKMPHGEFLIWIVFICAFLTDTFAMLTGKYFGKHKLCPALSPKKTIEGAIGGVVGSTLSLISYGLILQNYLGFTVNYTYMVFIGIVVSIMAQFGDIAASAIKREYGLKDYGDIMPGHGGVMDRFDSVLFTAPAVFYLIGIFPII